MLEDTISRVKITKSIIKMLSIILIAIAAQSVGAYAEKSSNENGVRIQVAPQVLSANKPAQFQIRLNTHSVELNQDLKAVIELHDGQGRVYKAESWEGSPPGGHHRSGILTFPVIQATAGNVTLVFRDFGGSPKREFSWKID